MYDLHLNLEQITRISEMEEEAVVEEEEQEEEEEEEAPGQTSVPSPSPEEKTCRGRCKIIR